MSSRQGVLPVFLGANNYVYKRNEHISNASKDFDFLSGFFYCILAVLSSMKFKLFIKFGHRITEC